jgi:membrane fusion protein, copper/silver efflux system
MRKFLIGGIAIAAILASTAAGYRLGTGTWPDPGAWKAAPSPEAAATPIASPVERKVLYWRHPDSDTDFSAESKMTDDGRPYVPVYDDQEADFAEAKPKQPSIDAAGPKKLLYYRNPMGLPDTSPVPKKDWMGMDYIPVYEGEDEESGTVKVSAAKIQRSGVRSEPAVMRRLARPIRAPGVAKPDERTLLTVALRADSFIEKLYVNETGRHVTAGEPLFRVYSPDMVKVQVDYRISTNATGNADERGALQRLENLQLPQAVMDELRRTRQPVITFDWPSPVSGVVMKKKAVEGMMMRAGEEMMMLADLTSIWVIADVPEQEIGQVQIGSMAKVMFRAFPNETFDGRVTFILHELEMATRTAKVRVQVANPDHRIKHEMFADVELSAGASQYERIAVPISALIDSGNRQVVIVDRGEGRFEPRPVKVGMRGDSYVEIAEGIKAGEKVVVSANFLIDAESNLKAALSGFTADAPKKISQPAAKTAVEKKP